MKRKKTPNPSKAPTRTRKIRTSTVPVTENPMQWRNSKLNPQQQLDWISELYQWADLPDSIHMVSFWRSKRIGRQTWYDWLERYPAMKEAARNVLDILGERREYLALFSKDNGITPDVIMKTQRFYDYATRKIWEEEKQSREDIARIRKEDDNETPPITVVEMETFSLSPEEIAGEIHKKTKNDHAKGPLKTNWVKKEAGENVSDHD